MGLNQGSRMRSLLGEKNLSQNPDREKNLKQTRP